MARPIPLELPARDPREELRVRLEQAPVDHAEALLAGLEVLQGLHDHGVLELVRGALGGSEKIVETAVDAMNTPETIRGLRNLLIVAKIFGSMDSDTLARAAKVHETEPPSLWKSLSRLRDKNVRRGLAIATGILEALGKSR